MNNYRRILAIKAVAVLMLGMFTCGLEAKTLAGKTLELLRSGKDISAQTVADADHDAVMAELRSIAADPYAEWHVQARDVLVRAADLDTLKMLVAEYESSDFYVSERAYTDLEGCQDCVLIPLLINDVFKDEPDKISHYGEFTILPKSFRSSILILQTLHLDPRVSPVVKGWVRAHRYGTIERRNAVREFWTVNKANVLAGQYGGLVVPP